MDYSKIETWVLDGLDEDYVSLHSMINSFTTKNSKPTPEEFETALEFLETFLKRNSIIVLYGEEMSIVNKTPKEVKLWLRQLWNTQPYEDFDFAVWFDKAKGPELP